MTPESHCGFIALEGVFDVQAFTLQIDFKERLEESFFGLAERFDFQNLEQFICENLAVILGDIVFLVCIPTKSREKLNTFRFTQQSVCTLWECRLCSSSCHR